MKTYQINYPSKSTIIFTLLICFCSIQSFAQGMSAAGGGKIASIQNAASGDGLKNVESRKTNSSSRLSEMEREALLLINRKRAEAGLPPLVWSEDLARVARLHSESMVENDFFSHAGRDGSMVDDRADSLGIGKFSSIGENIAYNRGYQKPVETAVEKWMLSASHRQNILAEQWKETGIGIAVKVDGSYYFTQVFLNR